MPAFTKMYILGPFQINLKFLYLVLEYWTTFDSSFRFFNFFWESCPVFKVGISNPKSLRLSVSICFPNFEGE